MLRLPFSFMSPAGKRGRLSVLTFHRVLPRHDPLLPDLPDAHEFERQMRWVRDWFNVVPLGAGIDMLYAGTIPSRALAVTFDDGYADNEELAAPILRRLGMSATFFVSTAFLGGGCMWNDRVIEAVRACQSPELDLGAIGLKKYSMQSPAARSQSVRALLLDIKHFDADRRQALTDAIVELTGAQEKSGLMMSPDQVRQLRVLGMDVGAHTVNHPILTRVSQSAAREEIGNSKQHLEQVLGHAVPLFAYPNGMPDRDYSAEHVDIVKQCGFSAAVTTAQGAATISSDRFQLPRFAPWARTRLNYAARLAANFRTAARVAA
jgi:peptidoglycan/xylan/chitin deacetylase (PgdA/CDA1 family)